MLQSIVVLPGDDVTQHLADGTTASEESRSTGITGSSADVTTPLRIGTGLRYKKDRVLATCAGRLQKLPNRTYFVQSNIQRYRPYSEDRVIAIVEDRVANDGDGGDVYRVNMGGSHPALLSNLSFEGATKRNKPTLKSGTLVYARVQSVTDSMDPILSCQLGPHDVGILRKDWMTNEGTYGELKGGTVVKVSLGLARELLDPENVVLQELSKGGRLAFEVCIGVNGYVWIHSTRPEYTILIQNAIKNSEVMTEAQVRAMVKNLVQTVNQQIEDAMDSD